MNTLTPLFLMALELLGTPYIYGANNPEMGLDCSGFVQIPLKRLGVIEDDKDRSAQMLFNYLKERQFRSQSGTDSLLFFGESQYRITHVKLAVNDKVMIGSSGGSKDCDTVEKARDRNAKVKFSQINRRNDLVAAIKIAY